MDNVTTIINVAISLATVFSLIVIWLTLKEMRIQRLKSYEPTLIPLNIEILFLSNFPSKLLPVDSYESQSQVISKTLPIENEFKVVNIGQGVAKDIFITTNWNLNYKAVFEYLTEKIKAQATDIEIQISEESLWIEADDKRRIYAGGNYPFEVETLNKIDYLLPLKELNESIRIKLPSSLNKVLELFILSLELSGRQEKVQVIEKMKGLFSPFLIIEYKDNLDNKFKVQYKLHINQITKQMNGKITGNIYTLKINRSNWHSL